VDSLFVEQPVARVDDSEDEAAVDDGNKLWETTSIEGLTKDDIQLLQANVNALQQRYKCFQLTS